MALQFGTPNFVTPCRALLCGGVSLLCVIYGYANEAVW